MGEHRGVSPSTMPAHRMLMARPKIKIIHIIAPEIIKTDVANFRDLVQRLTGKPAGASAVGMAAPPVLEEKEEVTKKRPAPAATAAAERSSFSVQQEPSKKRKIKCEVKMEEAGFGDNELWMDLNPGGFLSFLEDDDDVFQGLVADDFFQVPLGPSRMDLVGEMYAS